MEDIAVRAWKATLLIGLFSVTVHQWPKGLKVDYGLLEKMQIDYSRSIGSLNANCSSFTINLV